MKHFFKYLIPLILFIQVEAKEWEKDVSLGDSWRWNRLEFLAEYDVLKAGKGAREEIWFVHSEGLICYDGYEIQNFEITSEILGGVLDVCVNSKGQVCILTTNRLLVWDEGRIEVYDNVENSITRRNAMVEDSDGRVFILSNDGIFIYFNSHLEQINSEPRRYDSILFDRNGYLWALQSQLREIDVFEVIPSETYVELNNIRTLRAPGIESGHCQLFLDSKKQVWVFDLNDLSNTCYFSDFQRHTVSFEMENFAAEGSLDIVEIRPQEFWLASNRSLVRIREDSAEIFDQLGYFIPSTFPYMLVHDEDQIIIGGVGFTPQVIDLSTARWTVFQGLNFQFEDPNGVLWFLYENRKIVVKRNNDWIVLSSDNGVIDTPNRITSGPNGSIWVSGAHEGEAAVCWSKEIDSRWELFSFPEVGTVFSHLAAVHSSENAMIFGSGTPVTNLDDGRMGGGVIFREHGDGFRGHYISPPTFVPRVSNLVERHGDGLWFGGGNLFKSTPNTMFSAKRMEHIFHRWMDHMIVDQSNHLWIACWGLGIYQYDGNTFTLHNVKNGLHDKRVIYLLDDTANNRLLALTESGFFYYDTNGWSRWGWQENIPYTRESHTVVRSVDGSYWINYSDRSWFLGSGDFDQKNQGFKTLRFMPETDPPETEARIAFPRYPEGSQIQIIFDGKDFWDYTNRRDLEFSWKLNDQDWTPFENVHQVNLNSIQTGEHVFYLRARDRYGNVDLSPAVVYFEVYLPVWKEKWFLFTLLSLLGLILFLIYLLIRIRIKAALAIDEFKLEFFTNISHELRNPLAVIITPAELLLDSESDTEKRSKLQMIIRNARKMQSMVDQLLQFRKIETTKWIYNPTEGEVIGCIRESVDNLESLWIQKKQQVQFTCHPASFLCRYDVTVIQQIVDNLLSNAIKYSPPKTIVEIHALIELKDDHHFLMISVIDEGPGIPGHEKENILKPFYRIRDDQDTMGSGVGLALVKQLVNQLGGSISIKSPTKDSGKGSCFCVELPLEEFGDHSDENIDSKTIDDRNPSVLIIEDNEDLRLVLSQELAKDYRVFEASDGQEGFKQALDKNPGLIVSDVMMPNMDGFTLCEKLKSDTDTSHIPVILLTAKSSNEHRIKGLKAGADAYIAKPLDIKHLKVRMENLLESRRELKRKFSNLLMVEPTEVTVTSTDETILRKAMQVVQENMQEEDFDVRKFCVLMGMSATSLRRKIKAITGFSPLEFIHKLRMKKAARILAEVQLPISEVAAEIGIYDLSHFGKVFRKEFGVTPSVYRTDAMKERSEQKESSKLT